MSDSMKPIVVQEIREIAKKNDIDQVILFGSRARGDYHRTSDIDLAVKGRDVTGFLFDVEETTSTLLEFDIINLEDELEDTFRKEIMREGVTLYEKI